MKNYKILIVEIGGKATFPVTGKIIAQEIDVLHNIGVVVVEMDDDPDEIGRLQIENAQLAARIAELEGQYNDQCDTTNDLAGEIANLHSHIAQLEKALEDIAEWSDKWTDSNVIVREMQEIAHKALSPAPKKVAGYESSDLSGKERRAKITRKEMIL